MCRWQGHTINVNSVLKSEHIPDGTSVVEQRLTLKQGFYLQLIPAKPA